METKFKIHSVTPPSNEQVKVGILGTVEIHIVDAKDERVFIRLPQIMVRQAKASGDRFLSTPSKKVGEKYYNYFDIFPLRRGKNPNDNTHAEYNEGQKGNMSKLTQEVLRILDNGGTTRPAGPKVERVSTTPTSSAPSDWM